MMKTPWAVVVECAWIVWALYWLVAAFGHRGVRRREPAVIRLVHLLVLGGAVALLSSKPGWGDLKARFLPATPIIESIGAVVTVMGVALAIWARHDLGRNWSAQVVIREGHELIRSGPYARIRHPIYTGILIAMAGTAIAIGEVRALAAVAVATIGFFIKARREEGFLAREFGPAFEEYKRTTGSFLPRLLAFAVIALLATVATPARALLRERINTTTLTLPAALEPSASSFHLWTQLTLGPRLYHEPLPDGRTMVGWTDASMNGHVSIVRTTVETTFDFPAEPVRGLVAHADGSFAVLLLNRGGAGYQDDFMRLSKRNANGTQAWTVTVTTSEYTPNPALFNIGDSRLAYANGVYGAYLSVHSSAGHEGDRYQRVNDAGTVVSGGWGWNLSHSMAGVIAPHPENGSLHTAGVSDCYPSKALLLDGNTSLFAADADCAGKVSVQLGQMAAAAGSQWLVAMDAIDRPGFPGRGVGVVRIRPGGAPRLVWLTNTDGSDERDPVIARIGTNAGSNRFLVGWRLLSDASYRVEVIDSNAVVRDGPEIVSPGITWGARDDSYRTRPDGSISWVQGDAGSRTLRLHRYTESGNVAVEGRPSSTSLAMLPPYPNPLRGGHGTFRFRIDRLGHVVLRIHDGAGRQVRQLLDGDRSPGMHEVTWDGHAASGEPVRAGVYFATVESGSARSTIRFLLLR